MKQKPLKLGNSIGRVSNVTKYSKKIDQIKKNIPKEIVDISITRSKGRTPTQAFSEFLTNREQGDWAEDIVRKFTSVISGYKIVKYGKTDNVNAGDAGFATFYQKYQDELDTIGKRPDVLIFKTEECNKDDISGLTFKEHEKLVPKALMGWEIRSSSYLVNEYKPGKTSKRQFLSFTVKKEDIIIVLKWITTYGVPHYYIQVFFDKVYVISFKKILEIISDKNNKNKIFFIEKNQKNQMKHTIHIDISQGMCLGDINVLPTHASERKKLAAGRLLHYIKFSGGNIIIDKKTLSYIFKEADSYCK